MPGASCFKASLLEDPFAPKTQVLFPSSPRVPSLDQRKRSSPEISLARWVSGRIERDGGHAGGLDERRGRRDSREPR